MKNHLYFFKSLVIVFFACCVSISNAQTLTEADVYKLNHPSQIPYSSTAQRTGEPGSDCEFALPLTAGMFSFLPTVNSNLPNILSTGQLPTCLGSAPNQTWFSLAIDDTAGVTGLIQGEQDYDFVLLDATGFSCDEFDTFSNTLPLPIILNCSYSSSSFEQFNNVLFPNRVYYLVVTNFSNVPVPFTLQLFSSANIIPINSSVVTGKAYADLNNNCIFDLGDSPVSNATVLLQGSIVYDVTDLEGNYSLLLPIGTQGNVSVTNGNFSPLVWQNSCVDQQPLFSLNFNANNSMVADVAYYSTISCAVPSVQSSVPFLRRCFTSTRTVQFCNEGTIPTDTCVVTLNYEDGIVPVSFSVPFVQNGNAYSVNVGSIAVGGCGSFTVVDSVTCENGIGSFALVEAHISPISSCLEFPGNWDLSDLEVTSICGDSTTAVFTVTNVGTGNMGEAMPYQIRRNNTLEDGGTIQLTAGQSQSFSVANNNDMVTFSVEETFGNPFNSLAWAFNDCNSEINFGGTAPNFAINDQQPWLDQDLEVIIGAYDPNDKFAWPFGSNEDHTIERFDELEYRIRFQNTGNDTAFNIVLVDTISNLLDATSLRITGNSHPYIHEVNGQIVTFTFPNIQLPDSATNLEGSIGYIRFNIHQNSDNPTNYIITNFADIYFDFNPPIRTNTAVRSVGENILSLSDLNNSSIVKAFPVPAVHSVSFILPEDIGNQLYTLSIIDITGRSVYTKSATGDSISVSIQDLSKGIYYAVFTALDGKMARVAILKE